MFAAVYFCDLKMIMNFDKSSGNVNEFTVIILPDYQVRC